MKRVGLWLFIGTCGLLGTLMAVWLLTGQREVIVWVQGAESEFSISESCLWLLLLGLGMSCGYLGFALLPTLSSSQLPLIEGFQLLPPLPEYLPVTQQILQSAKYAWARLQRLEGGYEASGVFVVRGHDREGRQFCDRVLKMGNYKDIFAEQTNYQNHVRDFLPQSSGRPITFLSHARKEQEQTPAGVLYDFARLERNSDVQNLQSLYLSPVVSNAEMVDVLHNVLTLLMGSWYEKGVGERINQYREYPRLREKLDTITLAVQSLGGTDVRNQREVELRGMRLRNPVNFIAGSFGKRYGGMDQVESVHRSIIHGDLHSRNVLVERARERLFWFIDFSNTQRGPTLRDFCSLEADIKFCLLKKDEPATAWNAQIWRVILEAEERFSPWIDSAARFAPSEGDLAFLSDYPDVLRAWKCVAAIRELAQQFKVSPDWSTCALPLLHATLPIVYYKQCSPQQKEYALISAAWLCGAL